MEKLKVEKVEYHRVEKGETLKEIATAFESLPKCCPNCGAKMNLEG